MNTIIIYAIIAFAAIFMVTGIVVSHVDIRRSQKRIEAIEAEMESFEQSVRRELDKKADKVVRKPKETKEPKKDGSTV